MIISFDMEWTKDDKIDVLGLSWDEGRKATAVERSDQTMSQFLAVLAKAETIVGQNIIGADLRMLEKEGYDTSHLLPKCFDIRLGMHAVNGHLAGTGSYDLRSIVLLLNGRQGERFPLEWKQYESDLHRTCAYDAAACAWVYPTLKRQIAQNHLEETIAISHRCAPIFALMHLQGVRLDKQALDRIYSARKVKTAEIIEKYHLWEERGKKVIKKVPIWRSDKVLDICEAQFGFRPKDRQRGTWNKLAQGQLSPEAKEFVDAVIDLGRGANDAHWLGKVTEDEEGIDFSKVGDDGFIHPSYDICGSPDRAIASGPNIQNFPRPTDDPRPIPLRSAVVGLEPNHVLLGADFSSLETITNAIESDDLDRMRDALNGSISHQGTADYVGGKLGVVLNRQQGKAINHGFDKGESPYNLARTIFKTERPSRQQTLQCQQAFKFMLDAYPKTGKFRDKLWDMAADNPLVVTNRFGRRLLCFSRAKYGDAGERFAKHDPSKKYWCSCGGCAPKRDRWKYAIAFLGRSSGFDVLLRKMAEVWETKALDQYSLPMLEVHDELDYSVPRDKVEHYATILKQVMEGPIPELEGISIPASTVFGASWAAAH